MEHNQCKSLKKNSRQSTIMYISGLHIFLHSWPNTWCPLLCVKFVMCTFCEWFVENQIKNQSWIDAKTRKNFDQKKWM